jgi:hypothetical protein
LEGIRTEILHRFPTADGGGDLAMVKDAECLFIIAVSPWKLFLLADWWILKDSLPVPL